MATNLARNEAPSTPPSGGGDAPPERRDGGHRLVTILRVGKLICGGRQELCLIRNISEGGLKAHIYADHQIGERIAIELKTDLCVAGTIRWVKDDNIGVEFDEKVSVTDLLSLETANGQKARPPRLDIRGSARLRIGGDSWRVEVRDLSQGGAKVMIDDPLDAGEDAVVTIDGLRPLKAVVRWQADGQAGLEFLPRIPFDELIAWLGAQGEAR